MLWSRELSWPALQHNVLSLPRFQVETSRLIVLTTTDRQEDLMLLITMEYDHKRNRKLTEKKLDILQGEVNEIVEETLQEITESTPPETAADKFHDTPERCEYEEYRPEVINCDMSTSQESCHVLNFNLKLPEQSITDELDEYCDDSDEDDEYEYYYEEVTDDDDSQT